MDEFVAKYESDNISISHYSGIYYVKFNRVMIADPTILSELVDIGCRVVVVNTNNMVLLIRNLIKINGSYMVKINPNAMLVFNDETNFRAEYVWVNDDILIADVSSRKGILNFMLQQMNRNIYATNPLDDDWDEVNQNETNVIWSMFDINNKQRLWQPKK